MPAFADRPKDYAYTHAYKLHVECGFNVFPLKPRNKTPLGPWKKWQTTPVTEEQLDAWNEKCPGCNWAVVCGPISDILVVDVDSDDMATKAWVDRYLPPSPFMVRTHHGRHLYYRYPKDPATLAIIGRLLGNSLRSQFHVKIDVRTEGNYVVAPGSTHPEGGIYEPEQSDIPWAQYTQEFRFKENPFPQTAIDVALNNEVGSRNVATASVVGGFIREGLTKEEVKVAAHQYNRESNHPPLPPQEIDDICESVWKTNLRNHPAAFSLPQPSAVSFDGFIIDRSNPVKDMPIPEAILNPGSLLGGIMNWIEASSVRTHRIYAFAGALTVLASLLGQRVQTETGLVTNIYTVCVGGSASGKDAPKRAVNKILSAIAPGFLAGHDVASDVAILNQLQNSPISILILDEIGMFLKGVKQPNSVKYGVIKLLTELFSSPSTLYRKLYAESDKVRELFWHCLCVLGMSVPEEFYGALCAGEATNGFLARIIVCEAPAGEIVSKKFNLQQDVPQELLEKLNRIKLGQDVGQPVLNEKGETVLFPNPTPVVVRMCPEALEYHKAKDDEWDARMRDYDRQGNSAAASIAGRIAEHTSKVAVLYAVSDKGDDIYLDPEISHTQMVKAWAAVEYLVSHLIAQVDLSIAANEMDAICKVVRKTIQNYVYRERVDHKSDKPGAPYHVISRALPGVLDDVLKKVLDKMVLSNELRLHENWKASEKSRRPMNLYCLVVETPEEDGAQEALANKGDTHA